MSLASPTSLAAIPSPSNAVWQLGPIPIRAYALCIIAGIVVACWVTERRLRQRGAAPGAVLDIAVWAVPAGIIGARIYHVITSPEKYFGTGGDWIKVFFIHEGGLGIWGAVAGGAVGAWIAARQLGIPLTVVADALAPGLPLAQAIGRLGNWFNNELYGGRTDLPWGLEIHRMDGGQALRDEAGQPILEEGLYHPTFAYELLWNVGVAAMVYFLDRKLRLGRGRAFALYVMGYTAGRFWIEMMRTDEANTILGVRVNVWTAALVFLGALIYFLRVRGPREYLIPVGLPSVAGPPASSDVSQVDLSAKGATTEPAVPEGYRVVGEEQFAHWRRTGEAPPEAADPVDAGSESAPDRPAGEASAPDQPDMDDVVTPSKRADEASVLDRPAGEAATAARPKGEPSGGSAGGPAGLAGERPGSVGGPTDGEETGSASDSPAESTAGESAAARPADRDS
ncbi:prolipoprotein diacylglyceryl transferase [Micromonospora sediminimaris]|uniref:Phosphatidylglycerol--prolipoprotein diacylglyceryl transferase n=1 Tax=Micromonospora sediminimaris TaxID=547162 RepID=A0A9W5XJM8_9ACTN|nr:prolipoprotein diacylglyceryl transferase [Micromonospora sediminimaris]SFB88524.1 prolipoprotein diacylglyceryl transferase [Micromonospora sediminimaris]